MVSVAGQWLHCPLCFQQVLLVNGKSHPDSVLELLLLRQEHGLISCCLVSDLLWLQLELCCLALAALLACQFLVSRTDFNTFMVRQQNVNLPLFELGILILSHSGIMAVAWTVGCPTVNIGGLGFMFIAKVEGTRVQALGFRLKGCREKCENGKEKKYNRNLLTISSQLLIRFESMNDFNKCNTYQILNILERD